MRSHVNECTCVRGGSLDDDVRNSALIHRAPDADIVKCPGNPFQVLFAVANVLFNQSSEITGFVSGNAQGKLGDVNDCQQLHGELNFDARTRA